MPSSPSRSRSAALLAALALVLVAASLLAAPARRRCRGDAVAGRARPAAAPLRRAAARPIVVDVVGAVREPGLYHLADGARVADAVAQAGGLSRRADRSAVNLAARVADGQQVVVAARGSPGAAAVGGSGPSGARRAGLAQRGDRRAARRAARNRAGDRREDRRVPPGARRRSRRSKVSMRSPASARRGSRSSRGWSCREAGAPRRAGH